MLLFATDDWGGSCLQDASAEGTTAALFNDFIRKAEAVRNKTRTEIDVERDQVALVANPFIDPASLARWTYGPTPRPQGRRADAQGDVYGLVLERPDARKQGDVLGSNPPVSAECG